MGESYSERSSDKLSDKFESCEIDGSATGVKPVFVTFNVISNYVETEKTKENTETTDWKDLPFRKKKKMNET